METIEKVLDKVRQTRKDKGLSHENMAEELGISQAAYSNLENNQSSLSVERLIKVAEVLEKPIYSFFDTSPNTIYNQSFSDNSYGHIENLNQENKELIAKLTESYENAIANLKAEIDFLRKMVQASTKAS